MLKFLNMSNLNERQYLATAQEIIHYFILLDFKH
jgi:hypothetical protein